MIVPFAITAAMLALIGGAIAIPRRWRFPVVPLFAAVFVASYSHFSYTYLPWFGGEVEVGYFIVLGLWPLLGHLFLTRQFYAVFQAIVLTIALYVYFFATSIAQGPALALVDFAGVLTWQVSAGCYCFAMWKLQVTRWPAHVLIATLAALIDLGAYFLIAEVLRFDPLDPQHGTAWEVYGANCRMALVYPALYSLPLLWVRARD